MEWIVCLEDHGILQVDFLPKQYPMFYTILRALSLLGSIYYVHFKAL